jgi:hypothetical protein
MLGKINWFNRNSGKKLNKFQTGCIFALRLIDRFILFPIFVVLAVLMAWAMENFVLIIVLIFFFSALLYK